MLNSSRPAAPLAPAGAPPANSDSAGSVTRALASVRAGDRDGLERLFPLVYDELRRLARWQLRRGGGADTLQPTGLVHEAYLKLADASALKAENRAHFFAISVRAMRQVLVDRARARAAQKRGGHWRQTTLGDDHAVDAGVPDVPALQEALGALEPRQRQVVEYRFFAGLEEQEIAGLMGVSERTVRRDWVKARAWLFRSLAAEHGG
jgi:RNA polymerase sigma factor (TIGR02999 family)